jgi:competence protein ComEC
MSVSRSHTNIWNEAPFLRLLIPFAAGMIVQFRMPVPPDQHWIMAVFSTGLLALYGKKINFIHFRTPWKSGMLLNLLVFGMGRMLLFFNTDQSRNFNLTNGLQSPHVLVARIETVLSERPKTLKGEAFVDYLLTGGSCLRLGEKILVYFRKNGVADRIHYGSRIIFRAAMIPVENPANTGSMDYRAYCARRHIYNQVFLDSPDYLLLPEENLHPFNSWIVNTRQIIVETLRRFIHPKSACGLMEALLIGYTNDLDKGLLQDYTNTGVVHIIAISGMHLALIYTLLRYFLQKLKQGSSGPGTLIIVTGLWIFSFLCGGSPSVLRSAVMLTLLLAGKTRSKQIAALNSLAASAFLLLCYNPWWLWDIGFQLSYSAVLSLLIFIRPIHGLINPENKLLAMIWSAASVSIAAQVLTTPVSLFYFHQFPIYFLLTNLIAVPLSSAVLAGGLMVCALSWAPLFARIAAAGVTLLINMMNAFVSYTASLPGAVIPNIKIGTEQVWILYLIIFFLFQWFSKKNHPWLFAALTGVVLFLLMNFWNK